MAKFRLSMRFEFYDDCGPCLGSVEVNLPGKILQRGVKVTGPEFAAIKRKLIQHIPNGFGFVELRLRIKDGANERTSVLKIDDYNLNIGSSFEKNGLLTSPFVAVAAIANSPQLTADFLKVLT
jgi:hypothetical protein